MRRIFRCYFGAHFFGRKNGSRNWCSEILARNRYLRDIDATRQCRDSYVTLAAIEFLHRSLITTGFCREDRQYPVGVNSGQILKKYFQILSRRELNGGTS